MGSPTRVRKAAPGAAPQVQTRVTALGATTQRADTSRQLSSADEFSALTTTDTPLSTPYPLSELVAIFDKSNILRQCVAAMVTNVAMYGWGIEAASADTPVAAAEVQELQSFIDHANSEESLTTVHAKIVTDFETIGFAFVEVVRDARQRVAILRHAPATTVRLLPKHPEAVAVSYDVARGRRVSRVREIRRFRRYLQIMGGERVYFKEFGDPRPLHYQTGEFVPGLAPEWQATELIHFRQTGDDPYGVPRWVSQLPAILGSREAEEVNLRYFEDNTVPPMILTVAGGRLTGQSYRELTEMLQKQGIGKDRQHRILLIEAVPERDSLDDKGSVTLKVDKLMDARPSDGLFSQYDDANRHKVRSAFRLPPILIGASEDHTYASANISSFIAETQVFAPQRAFFDEIFNKRLVNHPQGLGLVSVALVSRSPTITNPEALIKSLTALNVMGAVTPRTAVQYANQVLQIELPPYPAPGDDGYQPWMDEPMALALKNSRSERTQNEQQQKTPAIKDVEAEGEVGFTPPEHGQE